MKALVAGMLVFGLSLGLQAEPATAADGCIGLDRALRPDAPVELVQLVEDAVEAAEDKMRWLLAESTPGQFPWYVKDDGTWVFTGASRWTSGFFPGALLQLYRITCDDAWLQAADRRMTWALAATAGNKSHHNHWYQTGISFGAACDITGEERYCAVARRAAASLATRFNEKVSAIRSRDWGPWNYPVVADGTPSAVLLYWGADHGGDPLWKERAKTHALTVERDFIRGNGGTWHLVDYDETTGAIILKETDQGYADASTWARGHAWIVRGLADAYAETRTWKFLRGLRKTIFRYYIPRLPSDYVPPWDFDAPADPQEGAVYRDSSAAAIMASGFYVLAGVDPNRWEARRLIRDANATFTNLIAGYLVPPDERGILLHGVDYHRFATARRGVDTPTIYGDYYFIESVARLWDLLTGGWGEKVPLQ